MRIKVKGDKFISHSDDFWPFPTQITIYLYIFVPLWPSFVRSVKIPDLSWKAAKQFMQPIYELIELNFSKNFIPPNHLHKSVMH